jgi:anti-sigma-K factor RskA
MHFCRNLLCLTVLPNTMDFPIENTLSLQVATPITHSRRMSSWTQSGFWRITVSGPTHGTIAGTIVMTVMETIYDQTIPIPTKGSLFGQVVI